MRVSELRKNRLFILQLLLPGLLFTGFCIVYPIAKSFAMSVTNWDLLRAAEGHGFVGLQNFRDFFALSQTMKTIRVSLVFELVSVSGTILSGLLVALLLQTRFLGRTFVRGIVMLPWAIPGFVACRVFLLSLNPDYGMLSNLLGKLFAVDSSLFLSEEVPAFILVSVIHIWKFFPFVTVMLLAALSTVPQTLYEAGAIDGANSIRKFFFITLPYITPTLVTLIIMEAMRSLRTFDLVYLITMGGPNYATNVIGNDIYHNAFRLFKMGIASAQGVILFFVCMFLVIPYFRREGKELTA